MPSAGRVGAYGIRPHKWPVRGKFMTSDFRSGAPVPCWYVLGRMQFAPTLTADNGAHASGAPVGNHFNGPIPYPASFPAPGGGLIFFCALFLYQDKKRVWGIGGKAPHDNSPRHNPAPVRNHFANLGHPSASAAYSGGGDFMSMASIEKHFANPWYKSAPSGKHFANLRHPSASAAYSGGGDFMSMASAEKQFVNSGHKPAPVGKQFANLGRPSAPIGKHFTNLRRTVASIKNPFGNLFHYHAPVEAFNEALFCDHTLIEVFNGV